jgi:prevent-host-death family protein
MGMNMTLKKDTWELPDAKTELNEVLNSAARAPQIITVEGVETVVVLSMDKYRQLERRQPSLVEALMNCPWPDVELEEYDRKAEVWRDIDL